MFSRPRDDRTKRYLCAGRRPGHQLAIVARPLDELVAARVLVLLATPLFRETMLAGAEGINDPSVGRALSELGAAQRRLQCLDDDFYVRGVLAEGRYRSLRAKLEREIDRLHARVSGGSILPGSGSSSRTRRRTAQVRRVRAWSWRSRSGILLREPVDARARRTLHRLPASP